MQVYPDLVTFGVRKFFRECSSTLYVGMPQKQNDRPYNAV